jgi:hypothetical protein
MTRIILLVQSPTLLTIDFNDIISILKGDDTIDNNINIFLKLTILDISNDTWITLVSLMNTCLHCSQANGLMNYLNYLTNQIKKLQKVKHIIYSFLHVVCNINFFNLVVIPHFRGKEM